MFGTYAVAASALIVLAVGEVPGPAAFDPPFAFPGLKTITGGSPPTEKVFGKACYNYVYGLVKVQNGVMVQPAKLPEVMMKDCLQKDKEGCRRFSQQLQIIVTRKQGEPKMTKHPHLRHGHPVSKHFSNLGTPAAKVSVEAARTKVAVASAQTRNATKSSPGSPKGWADNYGMKVWKPKKHMRDTSANHALLEVSKGPKTFNDWCGHLYAAATASWTPPAAPINVTAKKI